MTIEELRERGIITKKQCCATCKFSCSENGKLKYDEILCDNPETYDYFPKGMVLQGKRLKEIHILKRIMKKNDICEHYEEMSE